MVDRRLQVIAHRGASTEAPENTLAAFRRALEIGVDAVETDVHLSSDGELVVIHESTLDRVTDGHGLVKDHSLAVLRRLDAGRWFGERFAGERIPTLDEALEVLRPVRVIIEIKNGPVYYDGIAERVVRTIRAAGHQAVTISSFDHPVLREVRRLASDVDIAALYMGRLIDQVRLAREAGVNILHPYWMWITPDLLVAAHAAGLRVETWTVDELAHQAHVVSLGVDGIITNHPARLLAFLAGRPAGS
jgi:glycerophosphoryl diester phosphodiesterase